jgi:hypothetical protein
MSIQMHFIGKYQLELLDGKYTIVEHTEIHVAQDLLSQMPIIGSWYDSTIRNAVGQISIAGTNLLDMTGFLDFAPRAVNATKSGVTSIKKTVGGIAARGLSIGSSALSLTGVPSLVSNVKNYVQWGASTLMEHGNDAKIQCYSPTCEPGKLCYSPTCPRNQSYQFLSKQALHDIIKGAYTDASGIFK